MGVQEIETVLTDKDRQVIMATIDESSRQGALEAIQNIEKYCDDHIVSFALTTYPEVRGAVRMLQAIKELIGGMREYYEKPEQAERLIKRLQRERSKSRKKALKLAA